MTHLSILIPAYDDLPGALTALNTLHAAASGQHELEFLLQDDASPRVDFRPLIPPALAQVERNDSNLGFAANCNAAARRASGDLLFFVNQDVYAHERLSPGWDAAILRAFDDAQVGAAGARLLFPDGRVQSAGGLFDARGTPCHRCFGWRDPCYAEVNTPRAVSWVTGAALAIRREVFERAGGFDPGYVGGYFEDVDLCLKVRALGFTVWYQPACTLVHRVGSTGGSPRFYRSALRFRRHWVDAGAVTPESPLVHARYW